MSVTVQWLGHASFRILHGDSVIYIDPWKLSGFSGDATVVLVSHSHYDHYSADDIDAVSSANTELIGPGDIVNGQGGGRVILPGETIDLGDISIIGVASYNPGKQFHPKANNWLGFVIEVGSVLIYYAGDTDLIDEIKDLGDIDLALLPVGGTYTMNAEEAIEAAGVINPKQAVPYHWGDIVGNRDDAKRFAEKSGCAVTVLLPGESLELD